MARDWLSAWGVVMALSDIPHPHADPTRRFVYKDFGLAGLAGCNLEISGVSLNMRLAKTLGSLQPSKASIAAFAILALVFGWAAPFPFFIGNARGQVASPDVPVPGFWDPRRRPDRPDLRLTLIRWVSEVDYPPFNYAGSDGNPAGFNIELARLICEELKVDCTVQMRRFDTLIEALNENRADAVIASIAVSPETRRRVDFSDPYYRPVARFVARRDAMRDPVTPERLEGKKVAVVGGTAHEAYLRALFTEAQIKTYPNADEARAALQRGDVDLLFGDGFSLAFWLNGSESADCCAFVSGPFVEGRYFGEGIGIAVKKGNDVLRQALNWALFRLWEKGKFADLWLKYFPINPY